MAESRARLLALVALLAVVAAAVVVLTAGRGREGHRVRVAFTAALQVIEGQRVLVAGRQVGTVRSVELRDGEAVVGLDIDDEAWPLPRGTRAQLRYGSPLGYALRYVELLPGPRGAPPLPEDGLLTRDESITPVEYDDVTRIMGPNTRRNLGRLLESAGQAFDGLGPRLRRSLDQGAPGTRQLADTVAEVRMDPAATRILVREADRVTAQLGDRTDTLGRLITDAADTIGALASRTDAITEALRETPATFSEGSRTLARLTRVTRGVRRLALVAADGMREAKPLATTTARTTRLVAETSPALAHALRTANGAAPVITRFLSRSSRDLPATGRALRGLHHSVECFRPYAPELAGLVSELRSAYGSYDATGHYIRSFAYSYEFTSPSLLTPAQVIDTLPGLTYSIARAPGKNVGQPWYQPHCGITPEQEDPTKDLEVDEVRARP